MGRPYGNTLVGEAVHPQTAETFRASYPLHPEVLETLTGKTATLGNFQRVRGMLRLLARTIAHLWQVKPADATAVHLHHVDPGYEPIRQEIVTRLGQTAYLPAIANDVAAGGSDARALAQEIDAAHHGGMPPFAAYVARTIFMHTLAFNEPLKGVSAERLRYSVLGPATDISFIDQARTRFVTDSAYLDDRPGAPMRFLAEANLRQIIRREEQHVEAADARAELNDRIRRVFSGKTFEAIPFPGGPFDVPDEVGDGRPRLIVVAYDGVAIGASVDSVPELVERIHTRRGSDGAQLRALRNNLVFVVADDARKEEMRRASVRRLALLALKRADRLADLAEHQQEQIRELEAGSEHALAIAIQQCYRHIFYPSRNRVGVSGADLAHSAIELPATSDQPGAGQQQVLRALRELGKLRMSEDEPDSPTYVRDRTPLRHGEITTLALREEFRRDPALPILSGDDLFVRGIRRGVEQGDYVYRRGELLCGPGDPAVSILIDEQALVLTMAYARNRGIWPRLRATRGLTTTDRRPSRAAARVRVSVTPNRHTGMMKETRRARLRRRLPPRGCSGTRWCSFGSRLARSAWRRSGCCRSACSRPAMRSGCSAPSARCPAPARRSGSPEATKPATADRSSWTSPVRCRTRSRSRSFWNPSSAPRSRRTWKSRSR